MDPLHRNARSHRADVNNQPPQASPSLASNQLCQRVPRWRGTRKHIQVRAIEFLRKLKGVRFKPVSQIFYGYSGQIRRRLFQKHVNRLIDRKSAIFAISAGELLYYKC